MLKLNSTQRSELRSKAHTLNPVVMIGESGLTPSVIKEIDAGLDAHGLIKIRVFGDDREMRKAMYAELCETLNAAPIQHIGKLLVIYRPKKEVEKKTVKGKGIRYVTIVKKSANSSQPAISRRVALKGNERITEGGNIKRAKKRQVSPKKKALS